MGRNAKNRILSLISGEDDISVLNSISDAFLFSFDSNADTFPARALEESPDLIFIGADLSPPDGFNICRQLKSDDRLNHIPVIFLCSQEAFNEKSKAFESGCDDVVTRPLHPLEVAHKIKWHMDLKAVKSDLAAKGQILDDLSQMNSTLEKQQLSLKEKLNALTQNVPVGILLTTPEGRILDANPVLFELMGYESLDQIPDPNIQNFYYDKSDRKMYTKEIQSGRVKNLEIRFKKADGSPIWCSVSGVLQENAEDGVYYISSVTDITERKKIEEEKANILIQMSQTEKMASIGQLAAGVAHEINNPISFVTSNLNSLVEYFSDLMEFITLNDQLIKSLPRVQMHDDILNALDTIRDFSKTIDLDFLVEDIGELMRDCQDGLDRIKKIIIDLKDFAHPGKKDPEPVNVNAGIASTLNVITNELKYKATVYTQYSENIPMVMAVPQQINQVFLSILVNAAQAIDTTGEITIKTGQEDKQVVVQISDTGCGIPKENMNRIFDPFFTTKEVGKGTGLGMNIAYNIIDAHGGSIEVQSQLGKGTTFTIRLPVLES